MIGLVSGKARLMVIGSQLYDGHRLIDSQAFNRKMLQSQFHVRRPFKGLSIYRRYSSRSASLVKLARDVFSNSFSNCTIALVHF